MKADSLSSEPRLNRSMARLSQAIVGSQRGLDEFSFTAPFPVPDNVQTAAVSTGAMPRGRICCELNKPGFSTALSLKELRSSDSQAHGYVSPGDASSAGVGEGGYVYTRKGGFIDLGHVRNVADMTRYIASLIYSRSNDDFADTRVALSHAEDTGNANGLTLTVIRTTTALSTVSAATAGAVLAYEIALWHEITRFVDTSHSKEHHHFRFSPEDHFSNAVGALIGFKAFFSTAGNYDKEVDDQIIKILHALGAATIQETDKALTCVHGYWDNANNGLNKRNFDVFSPVTPWLVTSLARCNSEEPLTTNYVNLKDELKHLLGVPVPAKITFPDTVDGNQIRDIAELEFTHIPQSIKSLFPSGTVTTRIRSGDLPVLIGLLKAKAITDYGADAVEP